MVNYLMTLLVLGKSLLGEPIKKNKTDPLNTLGEIASDSDEQTTFITTYFSGLNKYENINIENHGSFFQIRLPETIVPDPGKAYQLNNLFVKTAMVYQIEPRIAAVRLFIDKEKNNIIGKSKIDLMDDRLVFTIDHNRLSAGNQNKKEDKTVSVNNIIDKIEVRNDVDDPVNNGKKDNQISTEISIQNTFTKLAYFLGASLILFILFITNRLLKKKAIYYRDGRKEEMMTLVASKNLSPKHKLTLVEIKGQHVLLGVSPDQVNFITNIGSENNALGETGPVPRDHVSDRI